MSRALLIAVGLALMFGVASAARTGEQAAQPRTLATVRGSVDALAQEGSRIAWIKTHARCGRQLQVVTLPGRRPVSVGSRRGRSCTEVGGTIGAPFGAIALASDGRVLWQGVVGHGNTEVVIDLFTASLRKPQTGLVATLGIEYSGGDPDDPGFGDRPLPAAADGNAILFYALCETECGPGRVALRPAIYRLAGHRPTRLARIMSPVGLAVSGRRFAVVTNSPRCCNFTPVWSHDGTRLAWIYHGNLWTIRADGTGDRQLARVSPPRLESVDVWPPPPSWSPDDAQLVFERLEWDRGGLRSRGIYRVGATGGGLRHLAAGKAPAWSPDGTRIAFVRGKGVYVIDPDGTGETKLTATQRPTAGPLSWSPDSTRIAVSRGGDIYSVRADGTGETRLTTSPHAEGQPAWSPNGAKIAFVDESSSSPGINVVNADGTGAMRLTNGNASAPAWSPDSSRMAFIRGVELWIVNADGSGVRRLARKEEYASPQWTPTAARSPSVTIHVSFCLTFLGSTSSRRSTAGSGRSHPHRTRR
jgi:WD40-like Beta Propeller Repeat